MNSEKIIQEEAVTIYFKIIIKRSPRTVEENYENHESG